MKKTNPRVLALLMTVPIWILFAAYFLKQGADIATGFFQNDNVSYIAYAHEYIDNDDYSIFYSNPFNESGNYPKIYFQPQNFLYLLLLKTGIPPGIILLLFTLVCSFLTFYVLIAIYDHLLPQSKNRNLSILCFCWGGGLLTLAGAAYLFFFNQTDINFWDSIFILDPAWGWWGLNLGRSLLFSAEAYYHLLFFTGILFILKKKWLISFLVSLLLSLSHPFTGVEYLLIITCWSVFEFVTKKKEIPYWFIIATVLLLISHVYYYIIYLNSFPEHQSVYKQYSLDWKLGYFNIIPAYCITAFLAFFFIAKSFRTFFLSSQNRLFFIWLIIVVLLSNHELFITPRQPLHFDRGYVWSALFIMSIPFLEYLFTAAKQKKIGLLLISGATLLFLSDNMLWIANYCRPASKTHSSVYITKQEKNVLDWIKKNSDNRTLIISGNYAISYLSTVESKAYPWISHSFTTPFYEEKVQKYNRFISTAEIPEQWQGKRLVFVFDKDKPEEANRALNLPFHPSSLLTIDNYIIITADKLNK